MHVFLHFGNRWTLDTTDALSRSRCREPRLNNVTGILFIQYATNAVQ